MAGGDAEALGGTVEAVLPEALRGVLRERRQRRVVAGRAVRKAEQAAAEATQAVAAVGGTAALPAVPEAPGALLEAVRADYLALLREPKVLGAIRAALVKPGSRTLPALLRAVLEFVGGEEKTNGTVNVTLVSRIPRPGAVIDVTPEPTEEQTTTGAP